MGIDILFTCIPVDEIEKVYPEDQLPGLVKINNLTGYVPERLLGISTPAIADRSVDIGYRSRKLPFWLGQLAVEKWQIVDRIKEYTKGYDLKLDVSYDETDRIYGRNWVSFIASCKTMLGVESGASVFDFHGDLEKKVEEYSKKNPEATFGEVQEKILISYEGKIRLNQISPRCFESAALKTVMLLYEGRYSGILTPGRHYISLKKDFSNFDSVLNVLRNTEKMQEIADCAYNEIACNETYSYKAFIRHVDAVIEEQFFLKNNHIVKKTYSLVRYYTHIFFSWKYISGRLMTLIVHKVLLGSFMRKYVLSLWHRAPVKLRGAIRPFF